MLKEPLFLKKTSDFLKIDWYSKLVHWFDIILFPSSGIWLMKPWNETVHTFCSEELFFQMLRGTRKPKWLSSDILLICEMLCNKYGY